MCSKGGLTALAMRTRMNTDFRHVLQTTNTSQIVLYRLEGKHPTDGVIPREMHPDSSQFIYVVEGEVLVEEWVGDCGDEPTHVAMVRPETSFLVSEGVGHRVSAMSPVAKFFSLYSKPEFACDRVDKHRGKD